MKRLLDIVVSFTALLVFSPVLVVFMVLIWLQDYKSPFYIAPRVAKGGGLFNMVKLRSMVVNASKTGVDSTSANDVRITKVGHMIRRYKLDELSQLWNVLTGDMSLVGPRPNVTRDVNLYTDEERELLTVRPGITDLASIVFADEGDILKDSQDPDLDYNQRIRPWKSRLALLCVRNQSLSLDIRILVLTAVTIVSRQRALAGVQKILDELNADPQVKEMARRVVPPVAFPPPGASQIVQSRG